MMFDHGTCGNGKFHGMNYASMFKSDCHRYVHLAPVSTSTHNYCVCNIVLMGCLDLDQLLCDHKIQYFHVLPTATAERIHQL
jgi:hypothetical protein